MTPVDISLDCLPQNPGNENNFHMIVVDRDYIATLPDYQGGSNVVNCSAKNGENLDEYFDCTAEEVAPGTAGRYKINLTLKKSLTTIEGDVYDFTVVAQVGESKARECFLIFWPGPSGPSS